MSCFPLAPTADFEVALLQVKYPRWSIDRMATMLRADRPGHQAKFAQSAELMDLVLHHAELGLRLSQSDLSPPRQ
jgi:hypothetical protein